MLDFVLLFCTAVLFVLFLFVSFIFLVFLLSLFVKRKKNAPGHVPKISVVIPAFNAEKTIEACLKTVFENDYPCKEVILVDDGSTDRTVEIAKKFKAVKIIRLSHAGKALALNAGVKHASNEIILTLDADTFLGKDSLKKIVLPFRNKSVGAASVLVKVVRSNSFLNIFQELEYHYNNLIRESFYRLFNSSVWFFGCLGCYRKSALKRIGMFKQTTLTEDMLVSLEMKKAGFGVINISDVTVTTLAPNSFTGLLQQRARWWIGGLQALNKNRVLLSKNRDPSTIFLFLNQAWWSIYSIVFFPVLIFLVWYWFPFSQGPFEAAYYLFRWFSVFGPLYVIYMVPQWGISAESIFGVLSGIIMAAMLLLSLFFFREKPSLRNIFGIVFYFPYTIGLNIIIVVSLLKLWKMSAASSRV